MAKTTIIGGIRFETKAAAKRFCGSIRDRYPNGVRLGHDDDLLLRELLNCHPEANEKIGVGVAYFTVDADAHFGRTRHFTIHRVDGSVTDFSFHSCIDGRNDRRDRINALREAVNEQIVLFRERKFATTTLLVCPLRGIPITRKVCHVDHTPPADFAALVRDWLHSAQLMLEQIQITAPRDNQIVAEMTDTEQRASWQEYHRLHAKLRLLSPLANLCDARQQ